MIKIHFLLNKGVFHCLEYIKSLAGVISMILYTGNAGRYYVVRSSRWMLEIMICLEGYTHTGDKSSSLYYIKFEVLFRAFL
jgi:hypothetical protein